MLEKKKKRTIWASAHAFRRMKPLIVRVGNGLAGSPPACREKSDRKKRAFSEFFERGGCGPHRDFNQGPV